MGLLFIWFHEVMGEVLRDLFFIVAYRKLEYLTTKGRL